MSKAEEHFDRVKATTDQLAMVLNDSAEVVRGPSIKLCGFPGPYAIRRPTPKSPHRLEVLTCTRPDNHGGGFHQHADKDARVLASWDRAGNPNFPPILKELKTDGPDVSV